MLPSMHLKNPKTVYVSFPVVCLPGLLLAVSMVTVGCQRGEEVSSYTVPKLNKDRLLAVMVVDAERAWFFKLTGPAKLVDPTVDSFRSFVESVQFVDGKPKWELPAGWSEEQSDQPSRFATVRTGVSPGALGISVVPLQVPATGSLADYELANVNRWLGQLQLSPVTADKLDDTIERLQTKSGTAVWLNATGVADTASRQPPFMAGGNTPHPPVDGVASTAPSNTAEAGSSLLTFSTPEGWQAGKRSMMRKAAFVVGGGESAAEITVIDLSLGAGELLPNVNRWRGQVKLEPLNEETMRQELVEIQVDDVTGQFVEMFGPADADSRQAILGVIAAREDRTWFVKLTGSADLAAAEKERFLEFVASIRFTR